MSINLYTLHLEIKLRMRLEWTHRGLRSMEQNVGPYQTPVYKEP